MDNPVNLIDPDGRDTLKIITRTGNMKDKSGNAIVNTNGEVIAGAGHESIIYEPGMKPDFGNKWIDNTIKPLNYITAKGIDEGGVCEIIESPNSCTIVPWRPTAMVFSNNRQYFDTNKEGKGGSYLSYDIGTGIIFTDEKSPSFFKYWFGDWGYRSPIEGLNHELEHTRSYFESSKQHYNDTFTPMEDYDNLEEYQAIQKENRAAATIHGENAKIRTHHGGQTREAKNGIYPNKNK